MQATKISAFWQLMRMDKPIGILLLLWPTLWALFSAANGLPDLRILLVFVLGVVIMRAAGCVINDFADRKLDGHVKRTKYRPLPAGIVTGVEALALFVALLLTALFLVLSLNLLTIQLSFAAAGLALVYPFMKRFIQLPQLVLGLAFSWAIPMAFAAQLSEVPAVAWLLFAANLTWTIAYDTQYAMVDRDDDLKIGIKSSAILFGRFDKLAIGLLQISTLFILIAYGYFTQMASIYFWCLFAVAGLFVFQQYLIQRRERDACFQAFLNNNFAGALVFAGIAFSVL